MKHLRCDRFYAKKMISMKEIGQLKVFDDADGKAGACTDVCILFTNNNIENNNSNSMKNSIIS